MGGMSALQYRQQLVALQPPGQALPTAPDSLWIQLLQALADEYARVDGRVGQLLRESDPRTSFELLPDWERVTGLPDPCRGEDPGGLGERRGEVEARLAARGAQTPAYFAGVASGMGYEIEIEEVPVSLAGVLIAGDELSADHSDRWTWRVIVRLRVAQAFVAGAAGAGDQLGYWRPNELECLFRRLKPAHTAIEYEFVASEG